MLSHRHHMSLPETRWWLEWWVVRMRKSSSVHQSDIISAAWLAERGSVCSIWTGPRRAGRTFGGDGGQREKEEG